MRRYSYHFRKTSLICPCAVPHMNHELQAAGNGQTMANGHEVSATTPMCQQMGGQTMFPYFHPTHNNWQSGQVSKLGILGWARVKGSRTTCFVECSSAHDPSLRALSWKAPSSISPCYRRPCYHFQLLNPHPCREQRAKDTLRSQVQGTWKAYKCPSA